MAACSRTGCRRSPHLYDLIFLHGFASVCPRIQLRKACRSGKATRGRLPCGTAAVQPKSLVKKSNIRSTLGLEKRIRGDQEDRARGLNQHAARPGRACGAPPASFSLRFTYDVWHSGACVRRLRRCLWGNLALLPGHHTDCRRRMPTCRHQRRDQDGAHLRTIVSSWHVKP